MRLEGKTAIVTGGAQGFGGGIVDKFVAEGAKVLVADIQGDKARAKAAAAGNAATGHNASRHTPNRDSGQTWPQEIGHSLGFPSAERFVFKNL